MDLRIRAGDCKVDANGHEPLSERARATIQADVNNLYTQLCGLVAANRGLTSEAMRGTDAAIYRGELAICAGLADRVGTLDLAIAEMAAELDRAALPARSIINPTPKRSTSSGRLAIPIKSDAEAYDSNDGLSSLESARPGLAPASCRVRSAELTRAASEPM